MWHTGPYLAGHTPFGGNLCCISTLITGLASGREERQMKVVVAKLVVGAFESLPQFGTGAEYHALAKV